jgi:hypothetical protein
MVHKTIKVFGSQFSFFTLVPPCFKHDIINIAEYNYIWRPQKGRNEHCIFITGDHRTGITFPLNIGGI